MCAIVIADHERDLFGGAQAGEESKFIVVGLRCAPVPAERVDEYFRVRDAERIDTGAVLLAHPRTV